MLLLLLAFTFAQGQAPRFVTYIDSMRQWWPPEKIAGGIAVPGYSTNYSYNTVNLAFWTTGGIKPIFSHCDH